MGIRAIKLGKKENNLIQTLNLTEMKRTQAISVYLEILAIDLVKMSDSMTDAILANTLAVAEINDSLPKVQEELRKRTIETLDKERLASYDEMITKANALEGAKKAAAQAVINDNYGDVLKQVERMNKALMAWLDKDVTVELIPVDRAEFVKACKDSDQTVTPLSLQRLAPMFKGYAEPKNTVDEKELDDLLAE